MPCSRSWISSRPSRASRAARCRTTGRSTASTRATCCSARTTAERREHLLTFVGPDLVAARWKQFRAYFADVAPGRSGAGGATLMGGIGASAAPMNGYPKVFNIESDPHEEHNIGEMYNWVLGPLLKAVEEYKASLAKYPNPPAANMTQFSRQQHRSSVIGTERPARLLRGSPPRCSRIIQAKIERQGWDRPQRLCILVLHDDAQREYAYGSAQGLLARSRRPYTTRR